MLTFGSLFAGIGGFDLGFERAGMQCRWQVENDPFCQEQLRRLWPHIGRWDDIRTFPPTPADDWTVDLVCGGFPCQDISTANRFAVGIDGPQSGLWREYIRVVRALRPRIVVVENVPALLGRGMGRVLGDLAASGYDAEWDVLSARAFGAHFMGNRLFIVASSTATNQSNWSAGPEEVACPWGSEKFERLLRSALESSTPAGKYNLLSDGFPRRVYWLRAFANAVVPQQAEWLGRRIVEAYDR
jgi:DNA (cytosine-5)-methyltransferase 1